ncbi:stage III sporulation protein AA [Alkaliphilus crotonatoxidans]
MEASFIDKERYSQTHQQLEQYLCPEIRKIVSPIPNSFKQLMEEIRLRVNRPLMLLGDGREYYVTEQGELTLESQRAMKVNRKNIENTLQFISNYSLYAIEEELKQGYITIPGGHRVGIVGRVVLDNAGGVKTMKDFSGLNMRISREKKGVADTVMEYLIKGPTDCYNTLIISPPQCGKTTLLRDIIRNLSNGIPPLNFKGMKVGVVDERSEIGGSFQGEAQNDLGIRTDLLDGCPKAHGMMMLIRSMSPQVIATDEIGRMEDIHAIQEALMAGTRVITTVHGQSLDDIRSKPVIGDLVKSKIFNRMIVLSNQKGIGTIESLLEGNHYKALIDQPIANRMVT